MLRRLAHTFGLYTTVADASFSQFQSIDAADVSVAGRWNNQGLFTIDATQSKLRLAAKLGTGADPILLTGPRLGKFQATFALTRSGNGSALACLLFNAADRDSFAYVVLSHASTAQNVVGYLVTPTGISSASGSNPAALPTCSATDTLWCRVQFDSTTLTVKAINSPTAPSESAWNTTGGCYGSTAFANGGGTVGWLAQAGIGYADEFTLRSWNTATSAFDITEHYDSFTVDSSGYASETLVYDPAGNLTYDCRQVYTYDAWNRLMTVSHGYRDSSGTLQHGQTFSTMAYDGRNRRIQKTVNNTGQWDCSYHYYYTDNWQLIETRNGSNQTLKRHIFGIRYIDELVQVAANSSPATSNACAGWFYAMQDANFNVLGLVNSSGQLVERYEYSPYGQRKVLFAAGNTWAGNTSVNDPGCYAIANASLRYTSNAPCFGLCDTGHQGLMHDEETLLLVNRTRFAGTHLVAYLSRDGAGFLDSNSQYEYQRHSPVNNKDPLGLQSASDWVRGFPPDLSSASRRCENICGPEIGAELAQIRSAVQTQFAALTTWQKSRWVHFQNLGGDWDITPLDTNGVNGRGCGTGSCAGTVAVNGRCFKQDEVNYWLFGVIYRIGAEYEGATKLTPGPDNSDNLWSSTGVYSNDAEKMTNTIASYRVGIKLGGLTGGLGIKNRQIWALAGFNNDLSYPPPSSEAEGNCAISKCKRTNALVAKSGILPGLVVP